MKKRHGIRSQLSRDEYITILTFHETISFSYSLKSHFRVTLHWPESESDMASRWVHRESNLMFTLSSDKIKEKTRFRVQFLSV